MTTTQTPTNPTIIRAKHDTSNQWFLTLRSSAQDATLSFEARGILWYLLSKSDNWEIKIPDLMREGRIGRDKVKNALIELANNNYLIRPKKFKNKAGKWDWTPYILYEAPSTETPSTVNQSLETSDQKPVTSNPSTLQNTEDKTQKQITENKTTDKNNGVPPVSDCQVDISSPKNRSIQLLEAAGVRLNIAREFMDMPEVEVRTIIAAAISKELDGKLYRTLPAYIVGSLKQRQIEITAQGQAKSANNTQNLLQSAAANSGPIARFEQEPVFVPPQGQEREYKTWLMAKGQLETQLDRNNFENWVRRAQFITTDWVDGGRVFRLGCENSFVRDNLQYRLYRTVRRVLSDCYGEPVEFQCEVIPKQENTPMAAGCSAPADAVPALEEV